MSGGSEYPQPAAREPVPGREKQPDEERLSLLDHRDALKFEHELIDRKLTRLLTSQTILFAAVSFAANRADATFIRILALTGLALCLAIAFGMAGNFRAKWYVYDDYRQMGKDRRTPAEPPVQWGVRTFTTKWGMIADFLVPMIFTGAWVWILIRAETIGTLAGG